MKDENYKLIQTIEKIKIIALSRFKKPKNEQWIKDRIKQCEVCPFNTKNMTKISIKQRVCRVLSNVLTLITTGHLNEDNSECSLCECTLLYKIPEPTSKCDDNRWKK